MVSLGGPEMKKQRARPTKPKQAQLPKPGPKPKRHEIPAWVGAPLWALGGFAKRHWKTKAWLALLVIAAYSPYMMHRHAHYLDDRRCDKINYAAQVAYQYGCAGRDCSEDLLAYEQTVLMTYGALQEGCYAPAPIRPDEAISIFVNAGRKTLNDVQKVRPEPSQTVTPTATLVADAS